MLLQVYVVFNTCFSNEAGCASKIIDNDQLVIKNNDYLSIANGLKKL